MRFVLLIGFVVVSAVAAHAADGQPACEADEATYQLLSHWRMTSSDARLSFDARAAPLWTAIERQPNNVFPHHFYQRLFLNYVESAGFELLIQKLGYAGEHGSTALS